ncbi:caldesmon 1a isoform X4 [Cyclopterus lumpus]|uniref:caldesmon 1a isoform X4 n=1 Tax=Cyclopterus lumpus TaxID=8103 RepID=UPI001485FEC9|nr:caldesmon 1a isoform X4 [Cyclopterus lumpus]
MEEMDFERRRELRRQKREEMRLEAERLARNDDDEEEAARERRRRARQDRMKGKESEEPSGQPDSLVMTNSHSVTEAVSVSSSYGGGGAEDEDQALLDRMAKREERRLRRMKEALDRQKELDPATTDADDGIVVEKQEERPSSWRRGRSRDNEDDDEKTEAYSSRREEEEEEEEKKREEPREEEEAAPEGGEEADEGVDEEEELKVEVVEDKPRMSYLREQESPEEPKMQSEELADSVVREISNRAKSTNSEAEEEAVASEEAEEVNERGWAREEERRQNGGLHEEEATPKQHRKPERTLSRGSVRSPEVSAGDDQDDAARLEAELKLEELKRRRDDAESEEFERMRQKQQEAEVELDELKKKREERKKVLEEEERQKKQEEAERKAREEEEKRKMKEEIERRRAEAAEKRQKVEDTMDEEGRPFKCVSPRGSSLKRENKESRSPRSGAVDLPMVTDSIRNIKSMWEKGNAFGTPGSGGSPFKEAAVMKTGVAGRINDWLNKTPESGKTPGGRPTDLKPVDVSNKRSLWENKGASPTKVAGRGETKAVANGMGH